LFSDHYWSNINTVYASGKGKISLAFVKDDIGNWDLKNMDNAPAELLQAYTDFAMAVATKGVEVAVDSLSGGTAAGLSTAQSILKQAQAAQSFIHAGPTPESEAKSRLEALQQKARFALKTIWQDREKKDAELQKAYETSGKKDPAAEADLVAHRQETFGQLQRAVQEYKDQVEIISAAITSSSDHGSSKEPSNSASLPVKLPTNVTP
jgi:hypothetical protein